MLFTFINKNANTSWLLCFNMPLGPEGLQNTSQKHPARKTLPVTRGHLAGDARQRTWGTLLPAEHREQGRAGLCRGTRGCCSWAAPSSALPASDNEAEPWIMKGSLLHEAGASLPPRQASLGGHFCKALRCFWQALNWKEEGLIISFTTSVATQASDPFPVTLHLLWVFYTRKGQSLSD